MRSYSYNGDKTKPSSSIISSGNFLGLNDSTNANMRRSTSHAYEAVNGGLGVASGNGSFLSPCIKRHSRGILATIAFLSTVAVLTSDFVQDGIRPHTSNLRGSRRYPSFGGAINPGSFKAQDAVIDDNTFRFAAVTDLDQLSRIQDAPTHKPSFFSVLLPGILSRNPAEGTYSIRFEPTRNLVSKHNEEGRGMELSELTLYQNRLLAFDDRTGTVFELLTKNGGAETIVVPRLVITEGPGDTDKGMKWEWATVKDGDLYMGSMGKEYTNPDGSIANTNNMWVSRYTKKGELMREDWTDKYNFVRNRLGAENPGYVINEAILWSDHLKSWVFLPRRVSSDAYDENKDERMGSNKICIVSEGFDSAKVIDIKFRTQDPLHGFSTFAFVPNTNDRHALAVRSVEEDCVGGDANMCKQRSYFTVFDVLTGEVLMEEQQFPENIKFEGIEFVNIYTS